MGPTQGPKSIVLMEINFPPRHKPSRRTFECVPLIPFEATERRRCILFRSLRQPSANHKKSSGVRGLSSGHVFLLRPV